jgi:hypothetical protein
MLPSGNDAAMTLAEHFGRFLLLEDSRVNHQTVKLNLELDPFSDESIKIFVKHFVKRMNATAK